MTGFGRATASIDGVEIEINIKSVNGRYLELRQHLPKKYISLEVEIQKIVKSKLSRGTVDIFVQRLWERNTSKNSSVCFRTSVAEVWLAELRKSLKVLNIKDEVTVQDLLQIPDFIVSEESVSLEKKEQLVFLKAVKQAVEMCGASRLQEGLFLQKTCLKYVDELLKTRELLIKSRQLLVAEASEKIKNRLAKILGDVSLDPQRLVQEVAYLVDRSDIEEELQRLGEHLKSVGLLLKSTQTEGKKLDFYAQELLREINTIGSKSQSAKITETVVAAKNVVEQLREQIQNIE